MAKIARPQHSIATRLRVVISQIVASVILRHVKIAQHVLVLIVRPSMIVQIVVAVRLAARVTVIRVQRGAALIAARRVVNMVTQRLRNVANSHRVLSAPTEQAMMICRSSAQRA